MNTEEQLGRAYKRLATATSASVSGATMQRAVIARRRRRAVLASGSAGLAVLGVVGVAGVMASQSTPGVGQQPPVESVLAGPEGTPDIPDEMHWQNAIGPYQRELAATAEAHDNFSGLKLEYVQRAIIVYGKGDAPADVAELFDQAPAEVLSARWVSVPYSVGEMTAAGNRLAEALPRVVGTRYADDFSVVEVSIARLPTDAAELRELQREADRVTDIPVRFVDGTGSGPLPWIHE